MAIELRFVSAFLLHIFLLRDKTDPKIVAQLHIAYSIWAALDV